LIQLKELEAELLDKLNNAQGDILDNIELIENLEESKKLSVEIESKVKIAKETEAKINIISNKYRDAADRGALFYFLLSDLSKVHSFYKYSLESFVIVINRSIDKGSKTPMYDQDNMEPVQEEEDNRPSVL
jgi:dynein heavy chain